MAALEDLALYSNNLTGWRGQFGVTLTWALDAYRVLVNQRPINQ
jgi:hypothetical protein